MEGRKRSRKITIMLRMMLKMMLKKVMTLGVMMLVTLVSPPRPRVISPPGISL